MRSDKGRVDVQVELTDYPKEVVEGEVFAIFLNVFRFDYPRSVTG